MTAAKKLTEKEIEQIEKEARKVNDQIKEGKKTIDQGLEYCKTTLDSFVPGYKKEDASDLRKRVHKVVMTFRDNLNKKKFQAQQSEPRQLEFPKGSNLSIEAEGAVAAVDQLIQTLDMDKQKVIRKEDAKFLNDLDKKRYLAASDEIKAKFRISEEAYVLMEMKKLNNFGQFIDTEHEEMVALRQQFHAKCVKNYEKRSLNTDRTDTNRDPGIANKMRQNLAEGRYNHLDKNYVESIANRLEGAPESMVREATKKASKSTTKKAVSKKK